MSRRAVAWTALRRRAVVGGRALEADGRPFVDAARLSLCALEAPGDAAPAPWARCHPCHIRPDGTFFFLDVPPGRYALRRTDADGIVVQSADLSVPESGTDARLPAARIEFGIVRPASRPRKA